MLQERITYWPSNQGLLVNVNEQVTVFPGIEFDQMEMAMRRYYRDNLLVQQAFSFLNADQREFLLSGLLPDQFDEFCRSLEEGEDDELRLTTSYDEGSWDDV